MKKIGLFSLLAVIAAFAICCCSPKANAAYPSFSFSNTLPVSFTDFGGVEQFTAVPISITDPTFFFGSSGIITGSGTASDYNVTLLDNATTYNLITNGNYLTEPFPFIEADDPTAHFTATMSVDGDKLSGTYTPTIAAAPETSSLIAFAAMLGAGGLLLTLKRRSTTRSVA